MERLALDYRETAGPVVVMIDPIAGIGSVQVIASTITELLRAIGPYPEELDDPASPDGYNYERRGFSATYACDGSVSRTKT